MSSYTLLVLANQIKTRKKIFYKKTYVLDKISFYWTKTLINLVKEDNERQLLSVSCGRID